MRYSEEIIIKLSATVREKLELREAKIDMIAVLGELGVKFEENTAVEFEAVRRDTETGEYTILLDHAYCECNASDRFDLAHRLGSVFLHFSPDVWNCSIEQDRGQMNYDANLFASNFLMPKHLYITEASRLSDNGKVNVKDLAKAFGVPFDVALSQGRRLGLFE